MSKNQAVVYVRVSTAEQSAPDKTSLNQQEEKCRALCQAHDWPVVGVYQDVVSGAKADRAGLQRLLSDAKLGLFQIVVFYKLDRLARNARHLLNISEELKALDVALVSVSDSFDTSTSSGRFFFTLLGAFAEFERDQITDRMTGGRIGKVKNGAYLASIAPFGYSRDPETGELVINPEQAEVVRLIFKWAVSGLGLHQIAGKLEESGVVLPQLAEAKAAKGKKREWHTTTIWKMLTSPRYTGQSTYAGQPMTCPRIIDDDTFAAAKASLKNRGGRGATGTHEIRAYALQHLARCRECGSTIGGRTDRKPNGWERSYYLCLQSKRYPTSRATHSRWRWPAEEVESALSAWVYEIKQDPEQALRRAQLFSQQTTQHAQERAALRARARAEFDGLSVEEDRIVTTYRKAYISEEMMLAQLDQVKARRDELQATLDQPDETVRRLSPDDDFFTPVILWLAGQEKEQLTRLISVAWLESDGGLTVEGLLPSLSDTVQEGASPSSGLVETSSLPSCSRRSSPYSYAYSVTLAAPV